MGRLGGSQGVLGPPDTPAVKVTNRNKPKAMEHKSNKTEICYMWGENPFHVTNRCMKQKMKQKRRLLHVQANNLLHVRKTHKTIHVTNRCMKQKMKQNRNLLHRSNSRTHAFFGRPLAQRHGFQKRVRSGAARWVAGHGEAWIVGRVAERGARRRSRGRAQRRF